MILTNAAALAPWLQTITTSRPEVDIQRFLDTPVKYDPGTDQETKVRRFAILHSEPARYSGGKMAPPSLGQKNRSSTVLSLRQMVFPSSSKCLFLPLSNARLAGVQPYLVKE